MDVIRCWREPCQQGYCPLTTPQAVILALVLYLHYEVLKRIVLGFGIASLLLSPSIGLVFPLLLLWLSCVHSHIRICQNAVIKRDHDRVGTGAVMGAFESDIISKDL